MTDFREPPEEEVAGARDYALALLARRPYPRRLLENKLRQKGFSEAAIGVTVAFLVEYHYLNDLEFAARWVSSRSRTRPSGKRRLEQELVARGIDPLQARAVIQQELPPEEELRAAIDLLKSRCRRAPGAPDPGLTRRLGEFLLRRGYDYETVKKALEHILGDEDGDWSR
jgi:regulatory protein